MADDTDNNIADSLSFVVVRDPDTNMKIALVAMTGDDGVIVVIPLVAPNDLNRDGKVSVGEWLVAHAPIVGEQAVQTALGELLRIVALDSQVLDQNILVQGDKVILKASLQAVHEAIEFLYLDKMGEAAGETIALSKSLPPITHWIVKKGFAKAFNKAMHGLVDQ